MAQPKPRLSWLAFWICPARLRPCQWARSAAKAIQALFTERGFRTGPRDGKMEGFFHGTGHGVGLEIHERPRISGLVEDTMRAGHVVTVEPGLYYPGVGGIRIEDLVVVRKDGCENLNTSRKTLKP